MGLLIIIYRTKDRDCILWSHLVLDCKTMFKRKILNKVKNLVHQQKSHPSISDWSKGKYVPKRDKLLAIAEFLSIQTG